MEVHWFLAVYLLYLVHVSRGAECPENEELDNCKSPCERTCQNPNPPPCYFFACNIGCVCKLGFIRDEATQKCVKQHLCPVECKKDEKENVQNTCEPTCPSIAHARPFVVQIKKCICKDGLVRHKNGTCIPLKQCDKLCGKNEELSNCANPACRKTCQNRGETKVCAQICQKGCVCKDGYIWDEDRAECVLESECPEECGENEVFMVCSDILCRTTCKNFGKTVICPKICVPGCSCKPGFIWDELQRKCVRRSHCLKGCGVNEVWSDCVNACAPTCQNPIPRICTLECRSGCTCRDGYLWDEYAQRCVKRYHCSQVCDENQEWCDHVADDLPTCQSLYRPLLPYRYAPRFVPLRPGCTCTSGYIMDEKTRKCISLDDCLNGKHTTTTERYTSPSKTHRPVTKKISTTQTAITHTEMAHPNQTVHYPKTKHTSTSTEKAHPTQTQTAIHPNTQHDSTSILESALTTKHVQTQ
ncbi:zonadhesin-like [Photinus pyralis]|uniref:zonadhesin-like n=1 Tax=Photinus pyralis TaxID=7054 RepID=UPI001267033E|nr:zonadhesin-like [Photinus pyralis]